MSPLDLADQASVAASGRRWAGPLDALVANAGIMATPLRRTAEGWEMQFATNHLGHFALALGLHGALAAAGDARIVVVSSVGHVNADVDLNPGRITATGLGRHLPPGSAPAAFDPAGTEVSWKDPQQGAATSVLLAGSPTVAGVTGRYFEDCAEAVPYVPGVRRGVAAYALDPAHADRLWDLSLGLLRG